MATCIQLLTATRAILHNEYGTGLVAVSNTCMTCHSWQHACNTEKNEKKLSDSLLILVPVFIHFPWCLDRSKQVLDVTYRNEKLVQVCSATSVIVS